MTIEEVQIRKYALQEAIVDLVRDFEQEVRLPVRVIHVDCTMLDGGDRLFPQYHANAEVKL